MILTLNGKPLPVYGDGQQIRDWLYVEDHTRALYLVARQGRPGETYNIGGPNKLANIDMVKTLCALLEELVPEKPGCVAAYEKLITHVKNRPGHDLRYAINADKIERDLGWKPEETFETGIRKTVEWYLSDKDWWSRVLDGSYSRERSYAGTDGSKMRRQLKSSGDRVDAKSNYPMLKCDSVEFSGWMNNDFLGAK